LIDVTARRDGILNVRHAGVLKEKGTLLKGTVTPLKAQHRRRRMQVRLEYTGHVGLIGKPATRCDFLDWQGALRQQASRPIDAPLDDVSVRVRPKDSRKCRVKVQIPSPTTAASA